MTGLLESILRRTLPFYFGLLFLATAALGWHYFRSLDSWIIGDWLINYQGGFVRRGAFGELARLIDIRLGLSSATFVYGSQLLLYAAFLTLSCSMLRSQARLLPYVPLIFSPFLFTYQILDTHGAFRKDIIFMVVMSLVCWTAIVRDKKTFRKVLLACLAVYPLAILTHEMLAVFLPYLVAVWFLRLGFDRRDVPLLLLLLSPSIAALALASANPGDAFVVRDICTSLGNEAPPTCATSGAIAWLMAPSDVAAERAALYMTSDPFFWTHPVSIILVALAFVPLARGVLALLRDPWLGIPVALSLIGTAIVLTVAIDWGRLIYLHAVSLFLLCLVAYSPSSAEKYDLETNGYIWPEELRWPQAGAIALFLLVYSSTWNLTACCLERLEFGIVGRAIGFWRG